MGGDTAADDIVEGEVIRFNRRWRFLGGDTSFGRSAITIAM